MPLKLLFFMFFGLSFIGPAMAQAPQTADQNFYPQQYRLHALLLEALKSGDEQKADQLRTQLNALQQHQFDQRDRLMGELSVATKSNDKLKVQQLQEQLREQLMPPMMYRNRRPGMNADPQSAALHQELQDAIKSKDKQKADQLRAQLNTLEQQRFAQRAQLVGELREAVKNKDSLKVQQLREQLMDNNW